MDELLQRVRVALADSYEIESEIGRGGMAIIYLGRDRRHDRPVAVKILPPHLASAIGHERFLQEIRMAAGLSHPYILPVLDSGERDGMLYYTMPFVEGENLRERLAREPELPIEDALRIADEMAEALGHAHGLGIVHRDVKPSNILLTPEHALLADFGVARAISRGADENLTGTGLSVGTPAYMSPQQGLADEGLDGASDQYSLACVIYEMIAGGPPFAAPTPDAVLRRHVMDPVPPLRDARPSVPAAVESTLERALSKSPAARFPSMAEFASSLRATGGADGSGSLAARRETSPGRRATLVAGGGLVLVATAFGLSSLVRGGSGAGAAASPYRLALLPCQAVVEADGVLGRNVANGVFLGLQGFTTIKPTPFAQSEAWAVEQALRGVSMSDSVANARDRLNTSTLGTCTIEPVGDDSIEVNYQLWSSDRDYVSEDVRLARTTSVYADVDPFVVALAGLLCDGSTSCGSSFRPTENVQAFSYYLEADELFLQDRFIEAEYYFGQAARADPEFALARWRQADTRRWWAGPARTDIDIRRLFLEHGDRLGTRDSLLLSALIEPPGPEAFARFETVLGLLPGDAYARLLYGDELLHRGPLWGVTLDSAEAVLAAAARLNPRFATAWDHLAQVRIRLGRQAEAEAAVASLEEVISPRADLRLEMIWRQGWLERFDPDGADANRPNLEGDAGSLALVARQVRYGDLPRAQLELGKALVAHPAIRRGDADWHSGMIAVGLALASLGRPAAASATFRTVADQTSAAALFADQWVVVPVALGLEGYSGLAASDAASRLADVAGDSLTTALDRARAAWSLALHASARGADAAAPQDFDYWQSLVDSLAAVDFRIEPLARHLDAVALSAEQRWGEAIEASRALVAYDSVGNLERPFARAAVYLHRGHWFEAAGLPDSAIAAWSWHLNTDLESVAERKVQAGEVDGAFGSHARLRIARLADASGAENLAPRACAEAREVVRRWEEPEASLTDAVDEARRIADACQP